MQVRKQELEPYMEHQTGSKLGKKSRLHIVTLLFSLHAEYITRNAGLDEAQAGIKFARRNINNLRLKHLTPMQETWVRSLGQEDPLEKEMATHSSILAWRISWTEEPGRLQSMGLQKVRHD